MKSKLFGVGAVISVTAIAAMSFVTVAVNQFIKDYDNTHTVDRSKRS